jgi:hypothetical protein
MTPETIKFQQFFNEMETALAGRDFSQMRHNPHTKVYALLIAGDQAQVMVDFMAAVGRFLTARDTGRDLTGPRAAIEGAFETFLARCRH